MYLKVTSHVLLLLLLFREDEYAKRMLGATRNDFALAVDRVWQLGPQSKGTKTTSAARRIAAPYI